MRRFLLPILLGLSSTAWAQAPGSQKLLVALLVYPLYAVISWCLVGWSMLVLALAKQRVETAALTLSRRPLASLIMGVLSLGWLVLAGALAKNIGPLGGLLMAVTLSVLLVCSLLGLPAILLGLGRRCRPHFAATSSTARDMGLGALVLFSAGGLPWLGQLMLFGVLVWACGGAILSAFVGSTPLTSSQTEH